MEGFVVNFKEQVWASEDSAKYVELFCERARAENAKWFKIIHGYGSHGKGGGIYLNLHKDLPLLKRKHVVRDFIYGGNFHLANEKTLMYFAEIPSLATDEDFNAQNPGVTIIIV